MITEVANCFQFVSLFVSVVGLCFLWRYVYYTKKIAEQAVTQTEASFKPAIIAILGKRPNAFSLRNIGKGPALDVEWAVTGTERQGKISYIEAGNAGEALPEPVEKSLYEGKGAIRCSYRSISGKTYTSLSDYDSDRERFSTTFEDARKPVCRGNNYGNV